MLPVVLEFERESELALEPLPLPCCVLLELVVELEPEQLNALEPEPEPGLELEPELENVLIESLGRSETSCVVCALLLLQNSATD